MLCIMLLDFLFLATSMQYTVYALNSKVVLHSKHANETDDCLIKMES